MPKAQVLYIKLNLRPGRDTAFMKNVVTWLKFIYSEKATNFWEISTVDLSYVVTVKCTGEILQNFVAFSKYMNFKRDIIGLLCIKKF
jgi:hypothetical protein